MTSFYVDDVSREILKMSINLSNFPVEILVEVFKHLDVNDLSSVTAVCRRWNSIVEDTDGLWKHMCKELKECQRTIIKDRANGYSWKEAFQMNYSKNGVIRRWKEGRYSKFSNSNEVPPFIMANLTADTWGEIFQCELNR